MKKFYKALFLILCLFTLNMVYADKIYNIDIDAYLNEDGSMDVTEKWIVKASDGSEWYKEIKNMDNIILTNFKVSMDGNILTQKKWDLSDSIEEKAGYYWINNLSDGIELCFGKSDYQKHTFTLSYSLSNIIFNLNDYQALAFTFLPNAASGLDNFNIVISSFYNFPDTLDVWGYGYKGLAYVDNGKIYLNNDGYNKNEYVAALVRFPINTYKTENVLERYDTWDTLFKSAEKGKFSYDYDKYNNIKGNSILKNLLEWILKRLWMLKFWMNI